MRMGEESLEKNQLEKGKTDVSRHLGVFAARVGSWINSKY